MSLYAWSLELLHLCSAGHFGTNVGYTTPYDVFIPFFKIFLFLNMGLLLKKAFNCILKMILVMKNLISCILFRRDIMVVQEGFMTNLVFGKGYIQYAFLGHAKSILPRVETDIPDLVPS